MPKDQGLSCTGLLLSHARAQLWDGNRLVLSLCGGTLFRYQKKTTYETYKIEAHKNKVFTRSYKTENFGQ